MKILGISFGKVNANDDILVKEALYSAKMYAPDVEVKFVNTMKLKIGRCIGCGACSTALEHGKDNVCVVKDDFQYLEDLCREADAIVVAAPVYVLQPVGQFKNFVDRYACRHDISAIPYVLDRRRRGQAPGNPDDFPMERLRRKPVAYFSVGGARTPDWTSMGTATMHLFGMSEGMRVISNYNANDMGHIGNPLLDQKMMDEVHEIGWRLAAAVDLPEEQLPYFGKDGDQGTCPVCHQNLLTVNGTTKVTCPLCGIHGTISIEGDKLVVDFPKEEQERARGTFKGLREHTAEIQSFGAIVAPKIMANKDRLDGLMERIKNFDDTWAEEE